MIHRFDFDSRTLRRVSDLSRSFSRIQFFYRDKDKKDPNPKIRLEQVANILNLHVDDAIQEAVRQARWDRRSTDKRLAIRELRFFLETTTRFHGDIRRKSTADLRSSFRRFSRDYQRVENAVNQARFDFSFNRYMRDIENSMDRVEGILRRLPRN